MAETATTIEELNSSLPTNTDVIGELDDAIRVIKIVLKNVFKGQSGDGFNKVINATEAELNYLQGVSSSIENQLDDISRGEVPIGGIIHFAGTFSAVGTNFKICDGANGTPNMVNRFAKATVVEGGIGNPGGLSDGVVVSHNHVADHSHSVDTATSTNAPHSHVFDQVYMSGGGGSGMQPYATGDNPIQTLVDPAGAHGHIADIPSIPLTTSVDGASPTDSNLPSYYTAAYFMRVS